MMLTSRSAGSKERVPGVTVERDLDAEAEHTPATTIGRTSGLRSFLPSFSNSKYARAHRRDSVRLPPGVREPGRLMKDSGELQVEPKVWLANESKSLYRLIKYSPLSIAFLLDLPIMSSALRNVLFYPIMLVTGNTCTTLIWGIGTFIKWQHIAVLLSVLSLSLYNAAGESNKMAHSLAIVYLIIAAFTGLWGLGIYQRRDRMIKARSGKDFDNVVGPLVVCSSLVVALCINFGLRVTANRHG